MEKSEPSLAPQWLKGSGNNSSSSSSQSHLASSLHSDNHATTRDAKNKPSAVRNNDLGRSSVSDRTSSAYFRRSSSSNGTAHSRSYSSFNKGRRDNGYHDQERYLDYGDSFSNALPSFDKDPLRRSQSLILEKQVETGPRRLRSDSNAAEKYNHSSGNDLNGVGINANKYKFERNFPTLVSEERQAGADIGRVPSPGLSTAIQKLPAGNPAVTGGDSWKSALVEVPVNVGSSSTSLASAQSVSATQVSTLPSKTSGLSMAETVALGPTRARTPPLLSVGSQRLEELAIKQSRQLIPVTPLMSKPSVLSPSEKSRSKIGQHHSSPSLSNSRSGAVRSDGLKTSNESRLQILKPSREMNGFASAAKDSLSPPHGSKTVISPVSHSPSSIASAPFRNSSHSSTTGNVKSSPTSSHVTIEKRTVNQARSRHDFFNLLKKNASQNSPSAVSDPGPAVSDPCPAVSDARPVVSNPIPAVSDSGHAVSDPGHAISDSGHAISDPGPNVSGSSPAVSDSGHAASDPGPIVSDSSPAVSDLSPAVFDPSPAVSSSSSERLDEVPSEDVTISISLHGGNGPSSQTSIAGLPIQDESTEVTHNSESCVDFQQCSRNGERHGFLGAEEEETAFLRELGWDENAGDEGGLTEEEIRDFYEYMKLKPSAKLVTGMLPNLPSNSQGSDGAASS